MKKRVVITGTGHCFVHCTSNDGGRGLAARKPPGDSCHAGFAELGLRSQVAGIPNINPEELIDRKQSRFMGERGAPMPTLR